MGEYGIGGDVVGMNDGDGRESKGVLGKEMGRGRSVRKRGCKGNWVNGK